MISAHETKHIPLLSLPFNTHTFTLSQRATSESNGTALWLCGQVLALYIAAEFPAPAPLAQASLDPLPSNGRRDGRARGSADAVMGGRAGGKGDGKGRRKRAIELGAGTGLTALALASMGWDVLATDTAFICSTTLGPNIERNMLHAGEGWGRVEVRALDWEDETSLDSLLDLHAQAQEDPELELEPEAKAGGKGEWDEWGAPYDLILTADTLYTPHLLHPLLLTLHRLALASFNPGKRSSCPVLVCLERRDPALIDRALREAKEVWGFGVRRVQGGKVRRSVERGGMGWKGMEGVEVWKFELRRERGSTKDKDGVAVDGTGGEEG